MKEQPEPPPPVAGRLPPWIPLLVVCAAWLAQGGVLRGGWGPDGARLVRDHPGVQQGVAGLAHAFRPDAWPAEVEEDAWRPLTLWTYGLESALYGAAGGRHSPFGFRVTTLVLHGLAGVLLLVLLVRALPAEPWLAAGAAMLFVIHPVATPALAAMAGRADVLALVLALTAALLWQAATRGRPALLPLSLLAFLLALLAKETVAGLPLVLLAVAALAPSSGRRRTERVGVLLLILTGVLYVSLSPVPHGQAIPQALNGVGRAAVSIFAPLGLVRDRLEVRPAAGIWTPAALLGIALAMLALGLTARRMAAGRWGPVAAGLTAFVAAALIAALVAPAGAPVEARWAYVVAPGLFLLASRLVKGLLSPASPSGGGRALGVAAAAIVFLSLGVLSWAESAAWRDAPTWYQALHHRHPGRRDLGLVLARRLRVEAETEKAFVAGLPATSTAYAEGVSRIHVLLDLALRVLRPLSLGDPVDPEGWRELGAVQLLAGDSVAAERSLRRALDLDDRVRTDAGGRRSLVADGLPGRQEIAETAARLARALEVAGRLAEAADELAFAAGIAPNDPGIVRSAGALLAQEQRYVEALLLLRRAVDLAPDPESRDVVRRQFEDVRRAAIEGVDDAMRAGQAAEDRADYPEAVGHYETALALEPTRLEAYFRLAWIRGQWFGDYRAGHAILDQALAIVTADDAPGAARARDRIDLERVALRRRQAEDEAEEAREMGD